MRILLIKPNNLSDHIQPSLGLGYLASSCRYQGHDVIIIDCIKDNLEVNDLINKVKQLKPNLVGFQCYTFDIKFIKEACNGIRKLMSDIIIVIGGPHPSAIPEQSFAYFNGLLDFIFIGEAEKGLPLLLNKIENKVSIELSEIPGLCWKDNGRVHMNRPIFIEDLDTLGMPAWDLVRPEEYPESQHGAFFKNYPIAPIIITRGCSFPCTFCAGNIVSGKKIRKHSINFMLNQIRYLYDRHGIREFHIIDDNFTLDASYAKELLSRLIALRLNISLATPNGIRIDTLDEELLVLMKRSGLYLISLGIESGSDRVLGLMKKSTTLKKVQDTIDMIHHYDIDIAGFFILGFPGETKQEIKQTIQFSLNLGLIRANYFTYLPFPGTSSYNELFIKKELGDNVDWERFYFMNAAFTPLGLTREELKNLQRLAFLKFYLRPTILIKNILGIKSFRHFGFLVKRFFHWIIMS